MTVDSGLVAGRVIPPNGIGVQNGEGQDTKQYGKPAHTSGAAKPSKEEVGWRRIVRNFTPSWFAVNMGTGIVSVLIHELPYSLPALQYVSYVFFVLNILLFIAFLGITILRYALYPEIWGAMIVHPGQSLFLGCFPMAFATIINMLVLSCAQWGSRAVYIAWALWWLDAALSLASCVAIPFLVMHRHRPQLQQTTAALLLPIVPCVVAAASGAIVAEALPDVGHRLITLLASYILWGIGETFSLLVLCLYFHRLNVHTLPPKEVIVSVFLPVGPLRQGGFAIQKLGRVALEVLPSSVVFRDVPLDPDTGGAVFYCLGIFTALVMWGAGLVWLAFAIISIATTKKVPFNMGWWGFTFPLGVFATCTGQLGVELSSVFFKVLTMMLSCSVILLWLVVAVRTLHMAITGEMFYAPCLKDLRPKTQQAGSDRTV